MKMKINENLQKIMNLIFVVRLQCLFQVLSDLDLVDG